MLVFAYTAERSSVYTAPSQDRSELTVVAALAVELDRSSPVPLYFQLAQAIEGAIRRRTCPGDRFENELALAKRLNLSRPTTRRAIQELVDKGLLVRKRGVGTQVVQSPVHRPVELTSLFDDLARAGQAPTTKLLEFTVGVPAEDVAAELNLEPDAEVATIRRLRSTNGEPLAVMTNYIPVDIAPIPRSWRRRGSTKPCELAAFTSVWHGSESALGRRLAKKQDCSTRKWVLPS